MTEVDLTMSRQLSSTSSLGDLIAHEGLNVDSNASPETAKPLSEFMHQLRSSRPAFLGLLKNLGIEKISDRQRVAKSLSVMPCEREGSKLSPDD